MTIPDDEGLWVRSDVLPDGSYGVSIAIGADRAWTLDRDQALAYAAAMVAHATEAEHDTAVFRHLTAIGVDERYAAGLVVNEIRGGRPADHTATAPLELTPAVGARGPFLTMRLDGVEIGQVTPSAAREHAVNVLTALASADLDAAYRRVLVGQVGIDDTRARAAVQVLADYWPGGDR